MTNAGMNAEDCPKSAETVQGETIHLEEHVMRVQEHLNDKLGKESLKVDGMLGENTLGAVSKLYGRDNPEEAMLNNPDIPEQVRESIIVIQKEMGQSALDLKETDCIQEDGGAFSIKLQGKSPTDSFSEAAMSAPPPRPANLDKAPKTDSGAIEVSVPPPARPDGLGPDQEGASESDSKPPADGNGPDDLLAESPKTPEITVSPESASMLDQATEGIRGLLDRAQDGLKNGLEAARDTIDDVAQRAGEGIEAAGDRIGQASDGLSDRMADAGSWLRDSFDNARNSFQGPEAEVASPENGPPQQGVEGATTLRHDMREPSEETVSAEPFKPGADPDKTISPVSDEIPVSERMKPGSYAGSKGIMDTAGENGIDISTITGPDTPPANSPSAPASETATPEPAAMTM